MDWTSIIVLAVFYLVGGLCGYVYKWLADAPLRQTKRDHDELVAALLARARENDGKAGEP